MTNILYVGELDSTDVLAAYTQLTAGSTETTTPVSCPLNTLYLTDEVIQQRLGLDRGEFYAIKYYLDSPEYRTAHDSLIAAARRLAQSFGRIHIVLIKSSDLCPKRDQLIPFFMDRQIGTVIGIVLNRMLKLLEELELFNPGLRFGVIGSDGQATEMTTEQVIETMVARQLV